MTAGHDEAGARDEQAVEAILIRYDVDMKMSAVADKLRDDLMVLIRAARDEGARAAAVCADQWSVPSVVRLAAGEMTAQELRTAQAVARGIAVAIRSQIQEPK